MKENLELPIRLEIGMFCVTKDSETVEVTSDDMVNYPYECFERLASKAEIEDFKVNKYCFLLEDDGFIGDVRCTVVYRRNLLKSYKSTSFEDISLLHFRYDNSVDFRTTIKYPQIQEVIMFVDEDDNCRTKILKNRYGRPGEVC